MLVNSSDLRSEFPSEIADEFWLSWFRRYGDSVEVLPKGMPAIATAPVTLVNAPPEKVADRIYAPKNPGV